MSYRRILAGDTGDGRPGAPFWKEQLQCRGVRIAVTPLFDPISGVLFGLLDRLVANPSWTPVFVSATTVVFAEDVPANRAVIRGSTLPKEQFFSFLLKLSADMISVNPGYAAARVARGDILLRLGDRTGAERSFEEAVRVAPQLPYARQRLQRLRAGRELPP